MTEKIPMVELRDVWKTYKMGESEVHALRGLTLKINHGEFVAIQGPSGSGKSTAMNMVGALDVPTKGDIILHGHNIAHLSESDLAQIRGKKVGFVFQQFNLINSLTVLGNVTLPAIFQGKTHEQRIKKAESLLKMVGLENRMRHKPLQLSGGEQQRVAICRALINNPELLLADEPTGNLDSKTGMNVIEFLKKLHKEEGRTIVMVTHDQNIAKHADRTVFIRDGQATKI